MKKSLVTLALAAVPALVLSACNGGGSGTSAVAPLPNAPQLANHGRAHPNDNGTQDLHAGGADFPGYAYNLDSQPVGLYSQPQSPPAGGSLFYAVPTKGTIYYCITGSTYGRAEFIQNNGTATTACAALGQAATGFGGRQDPLDFVASSVGLKSSEYTTYKSNRESGSVQWGEPFEFPQIGGPIVIPFRPSDFAVSQIKLSTWTYCAIANGTVSDWNDGAITADNGGTSVTGGVSQTIKFFFRGDGGGTTYAFENHLNTVCNVSFKSPYSKPPYGGNGRSAAWAFGVGTTWAGPGSSGDPDPNFVGEQGDPGIVNAVQTTAFGTGYVTGAYVRAGTSPRLAQALLQNGTNRTGAAVFTDPTNKKQVVAALKRVTARAITYGEGSDGQPLGTSAPWCVLYVDPKNFVNPPKGAYPIVTISYLLFYGQNNGVHTADKKTLVKWLQGKAANTVTNRLEYAPMSSGIETAVLAALNGNGGSEPACLR
ncbi:MAG: substrate-binding domain-containing protein [Candidatus Eremiobacteraeota bacterium]|nr:substrate-binding domain-containing protein [Candidatus Eremiobacteraeota bacterium]MBV8498332.1 substrate-binding domain-containing protein [Candidatus Eremiobacteraeota bacterium]